jgi:hypothetical protein
MAGPRTTRGSEIGDLSSNCFRRAGSNLPVFTVFLLSEGRISVELKQIFPRGSRGEREMILTLSRQEIIIEKN